MHGGTASFCFDLTNTIFALLDVWLAPIVGRAKHSNLAVRCDAIPHKYTKIENLRLLALISRNA